MLGCQSSNMPQCVSDGWWRGWHRQRADKLWKFFFFLCRCASVMISCMLCDLQSVLGCTAWMAAHASWGDTGLSARKLNFTLTIKKHASANSVPHINMHTQKINTMSVLHTPPSTLYCSLWGLKHGNPISLVFFFSPPGKDTLHEACGNLLILHSLIMVVLLSLKHQRSVSCESPRDSPGQYLNTVLDGFSGWITKNPVCNEIYLSKCKNAL